MPENANYDDDVLQNMAFLIKRLHCINLHMIVRINFRIPSFLFYHFILLCDKKPLIIYFKKEKAAKEKTSTLHTSEHSEIEDTLEQSSSIDPATLSKARSLSIDTIKSSLEKKIKDRNLSLSTEPAAGSNEPQKIKKKTKSTENSLSGLLTFDHVPSALKKEDQNSVTNHRRISPKKNFIADKESKFHKV